MKRFFFPYESSCPTRPGLCNIRVTWGVCHKGRFLSPPRPGLCECGLGIYTLTHSWVIFIFYCKFMTGQRTVSALFTHMPPNLAQCSTETGAAELFLDG